MMSVVGVVGVVVVVIVVVGGEQLLYMGPPRAHVCFSKIQKKFPIFLFFLNAHVWINCPCMVDEGGSLFILNL